MADSILALPPETSLLPEGAEAVVIDWAKVADHLAGHGIAFDRGFTPRQFVGGLANVNMLVRVDGMFAVLRRPPAGPIPKGAHDMAREHRVLAGLAPVLPLAPRSLHFCDDPEIAGAPFQILEYRSGRLVKGDSMAPLDDSPETAAAVSRMLIETLARLHAVDPDKAGLGTLGRPEGFLARTAAGWIARAEAILEGSLCAEARACSRWLVETPPIETDRPVLLHGDFKLDNMLLHGDRIEPVALLDWDMATRGNPLYDLASLFGYWAEPGDPPCMHALRQMPSCRAGFLTRAEAASLYAQLTGRSLEGFRFSRVLAMFRQAVVFHQLKALGRTNQRLADHLGAFDPDELFAYAHDIAFERAD